MLFAYTFIYMYVNDFGCVKVAYRLPSREELFITTVSYLSVNLVFPHFGFVGRMLALIASSCNMFDNATQANSR